MFGHFTNRTFANKIKENVRGLFKTWSTESKVPQMLERKSTNKERLKSTGKFKPHI